MNKKKLFYLFLLLCLLSVAFVWGMNKIEIKEAESLEIKLPEETHSYITLAFSFEETFQTIKHKYGENKKICFDCYHTLIIDEQLVIITTFFKKNIQILNLKCCEFLTDACILLISDLPNLLELDLSHCPKITSEGLLKLKNLPNLQILYLRSPNEQVADKTLESFAKFKKLQKLIITSCENITDVGIKHLSTLSKLQKLHLSGFFGITNEGLKCLNKLKGLQELCFKMEEMSDQDLKGLAKLKKLQFLSIRYNNGITDNGLVRLTKLKNLEKLLIYCCEKISHEVREKLKKKNTQLQIICFRGL